MTPYIQGSCTEMCPPSEVKMRAKEHLLHFFELSDGKPYNPVKCFSRSAAGMKTPKKVDLRTEKALEKTVQYLLKDIIMDKRKSFVFVYDFIFDRLRCVRQEMVIQNLNSIQSTKLLEPSILFLAYSRYRLAEESFENFDPKICEQHLQECLKKVLCCYDEMEINLTQNQTILEESNRILIESLYLLFNLGKTESLFRSCCLKSSIRENPVYLQCRAVSLEYFRGNKFKCLNLISKLNHIFCAIASLEVQNIRRDLLLQFSYAYSSKQLTVPINFIKNILHYSKEEEVIICLEYFKIEISADKKSAKFSKSNFDAHKAVLQSIHESFVEDKLKQLYLPELLLLKRYHL